MDNGTNGTKSLGNTNKALKCRRYVFTLNNWSEEEYKIIKNEMEQMTQYFCMGKEVGENQTPHLQGYLEYKNPISFNSIKKIIPRGHIEKARGDRLQNLKYCSKEGNYITNIEEPEKIKIIESLYPWQQELYDILCNEPDDRSIYWYWNADGNIGKSALAKYLVIKKNALVVAGNVADVKYTVAMCKKFPKIIIWDLSRCNVNNLSYDGLEQVKNGLFCSNKYESKMVVGNSPHVVVFANSPPRTEELSNDRWIIKEL